MENIFSCTSLHRDNWNTCGSHVNLMTCKCFQPLDFYFKWWLFRYWSLHGKVTLFPNKMICFTKKFVENTTTYFETNFWGKEQYLILRKICRQILINVCGLFCTFLCKCNMYCTLTVLPNRISKVWRIRYLEESMIIFVEISVGNTGIFCSFFQIDKVTFLFKAKNSKFKSNAAIKCMTNAWLPKEYLISIMKFNFFLYFYQILRIEYEAARGWNFFDPLTY